MQIFKNTLQNIDEMFDKEKFFWIEIGPFLTRKTAWSSNIDNIKNLLLKNGYKLAINKSKMIYTIGPFADISHAKDESSKLTKLLGIDNKISSFIF